jgi:hypothetical protein
MASAAQPAPLHLTGRLKLLHDSLLGEGDVDIPTLYLNVIGPPERPLREAQQYLGSYITDLNRKLAEHGQVVRPGRLKGTYHLTTL